MPSEFHTQMGFHALQLRLSKTLSVLANEKGLRLMNPIWMDGSLSLPVPGGPVSLTIVLSSGEQEKVSLDAAQLTSWLENRWSTVDQQLRQALDALKTRRPK